MKEIARLAVYNLYYRKLRTFLTLTGVVIGVASIVGLIGAAEGINSVITGEIEKFQSNVIAVLPGEFKLQFSPLSQYEGMKAGRLTEKDADEISKIPGAETVMPSVSSRVRVEYGGETMILTVFAADPEKFREIDTIGVLEGRYFRSGREVLLGYSVARELFEKEVGIRKKVRINGVEFRVVGVMNKAGGLFRAFDTMIYVPRTSAKRYLGLSGVTEIDVKVGEGYDPGDVAARIEEKLKELRKGEKDFTVISPDFSRSIANQILSAMQILLGGIAGISFLVGAIGISNMMFTSVLERTREIGIMKAIGATRRHVMAIFLIESGLIGLFGGILGVIFGYGIGEGFLALRQYFVEKSGVQTVLERPHVLISPELVVAALLFSFAVGVLAGAIPAKRAADLHPAEALRYE